MNHVITCATIDQLVDTMANIERTTPHVMWHLDAPQSTLEEIAAKLRQQDTNLSRPQPVQINFATSVWVSDSTTLTIICREQHPSCVNHANARRVITTGNCHGRFTWHLGKKEERCVVLQ